VIETAGYSIEFDCHGDTYGNTGSKTEEGTKAEAVTDAEDNRVRYHAREQAQWAVLSTQQIVSKIETTQHIQAASANADGGNGVVVES
jgi:hypothetical protein